MVDIERLDRALAEIEAHPELHRQGTWLIKLDCGTGGCLAGMVMLQEYPQGVPDRMNSGRMAVSFDALRLPNGNLIDVERGAAELLGIGREQRLVLFAPENTLEHLKAMRDLLAADSDASYEDLCAVAEGVDPLAGGDDE